MDPFTCEREGCGHPLSWHNPCHAPGLTITVEGQEPTVRPCDCQQFLPADKAVRIASLTDTADGMNYEQAQRVWQEAQR